MSAPGWVLLADAEEPSASRLAALLVQGGYRVARAASSAEARAHLDEARPDAVLIDIGLAGEGLALAAEVVERFGRDEVSLVLMGQSADVEVRMRGFDVGAVDFLPKPVEAREVLARIKRHVTVARVRSALMESEAKFRSVTESAIDAIISSDESGLIRGWNKAAEAILGHRAEDVIGQPIEVIIPSRFRAQHRAGMDRVTRGEPGRVIGRTVELFALHASGRELPIELSLATWVLAGRRYYTGILRDITLRREAEQRFRAVTESAIDAIVSADALGTITAWNGAAERMFGYAEAEVVGKSLELIIPARFHAQHREGMARVTAGGEGRVIGKTVEVAALTKSGAEIPIELSLSTWLLDGQRYYTGILRDVTERKRAEQKLASYAEELAQKHRELELQHAELRRSKDALARSVERFERLFSLVAEAMEGSTIAGRYALERRIARGGFGVVYEGRDVERDTRVAVKVLSPPSDDEHALERFRRESMAALIVDHPNAVDVFDHGISDSGLPYIVMELLEGETLRARLKRDQTLSVGEAISIAADVAAVLAAAHEAGIVHRDVTPANVFLHREWDEGEPPVVKVLDFGIAKLATGGLTITQPSEVLGTPAYLAPERVIGQGVGPPADVYALGCVLYEVLTGAPPFSATDAWEQMLAPLHRTAEPLDAIDPALPEALSRTALRTLDRDPRERPSAAELEAALRALSAELPASTLAHRVVPRDPSAR